MTQTIVPQMVIIAVEDPNILYLLRRYAEECGFETVSVSPSAGILSLTRRLHPALIILDSSPPPAIRRLLRGLQTRTDTSRIPVLVYAGPEEASSEHWQRPPRAWSAGAAVYLPKSVQYDDFLAVLEYTGIRSDAVHIWE